jgi:succinyl-CoA synthetase alpha subunit
MPGNVGVVSRGGALTYETVFALTKSGVGQSTCVGIGGDPIHGLGFINILQMFEEDPDTEQVVLIGEIGGTEEQEAADFITKHMTKPVIALVVGRNAPHGKTMGHAGALVEGNSGTAAEKISKFKSIGVLVADYLEQIPELLKNYQR